MHEINRRDFLRKSGAGLAAGITSAMWFDLLAHGKIPPPSSAFFEERFGVSQEDMRKILEVALTKGGEFSELFFEYRITNSVRMEEDIIKDSSENISLGVGIRVLKGAQTGYGYTDDLSFEKMKQTALTAAAIAAGMSKSSIANLTQKSSNLQVYDLKSPLNEIKLGAKVELVKEAYNAVKSYDARIVKAQVSFMDEIQYVTIANSEGLLISDVRPQVMMAVSATAEEKGIRNTGFKTAGGRYGLGFYQNIMPPKEVGKKAAQDESHFSPLSILRQASSRLC